MLSPDRALCPIIKKEKIMSRNQYLFEAPWGALLRSMTLLSVALLGGMAAVGVLQRPSGQVVWVGVMIALPLTMLATAVFFVIRGYVLYPDELFVKRLGWYSKIRLDGLLGVEYDPEATKRIVRRFGNGGMFCFAGYYKSKKIGPFRAFATDWRRTVVLRFEDRSIVVTPDDPMGFVDKIKSLRGL